MRIWWREGSPGMTPLEFSRPVRTDTIGTAARPFRIAAEPKERAALARRFDLAALERLEAEVEVFRSNEDIVATGRLSADLVQSCVASATPLPASVAEDFSITFRPEPVAGRPGRGSGTGRGRA
jgi:hypothetical protein